MIYDNAVTPDTTALTQWQPGKTVSHDAIEAFGGIDKCFAAEPIPDGVWQRMQGKTYKENPYIGRDDLRHIRALHWDYDDQIHVGEMIVNAQIADRVAHIFRQLFDAKYPIQRMLLPDVYDADNDAQRQLRIGMEAQVWPANEKRDEVGYVRGRISQVVRYPARISKVRQKLKSDILAQRLTDEGQDLVYEVRIDLLRC